MNYTMKMIHESLPKNKSKISSFWVKFFARRISFSLTWVCLNLGISANFVSVLSVIITFIGCVFLSINNPECRIIGVVLINMWIVLDCIDGNIARCKKQLTHFGDFFDAIGGYTFCAFTLLAVGIAAFNTSYMFGGEYNYLFIIIGALGSISNLFARLVYQKHTNCCFMAAQKKNNLAGYQPENTSFYDPNAKKNLTYYRLRIDRQIGNSGLFMPFLIVSVIFNVFDIMVVLYSAYYFMSMAGALFIYLKKADVQHNHI